MLWLRLGRAAPLSHQVARPLWVLLQLPPCWPRVTCGVTVVAGWVCWVQFYSKVDNYILWIWYMIYIYLLIYIYILIYHHSYVIHFCIPTKKYSNFNCTSKIWSQECKTCNREVAFRSGYAKPFRTQPLHQMPRLHHRQSLVFNRLNQHERWKKHVIHYVYRWIWKWYG